MRLFGCLVVLASLMAGCYPTIHRIKLSAGNEHEMHPLLFVRGTETGTVFTVWTREGNEQFDVSPHLFFRRGSLKTGSFSPGVSLGSILGATEADLAVAGSNVYVAFADGPNLQSAEAVLQVSHDTGGIFARTVVSESPAVRRPVVAAQADTVHVAWQLATGAVRYRRSLDKAATFADAITLAESGTLARPGIAAEGQTVVVAWIEDGGVRFARSNDEGASFASAVTVSGSGASVQGETVRMLLDNGSLHLLWIEDTDGSPRVMHAFVESAGAEPAVRSADEGAGSASDAWMAIEGTKAHVVWQSSSAGQSEIRYAAVSGSAAFSSPVDLSASSGTSSLAPRVSAANGKAHVVWMEGSNVVYRRGSAQGVFSGTKLIEPSEPELVGLTPRIDGRLDEDHSVLWVSQRASGTDVWYYSYRPYRVN